MHKSPLNSRFLLAILITAVFVSPSTSAEPLLAGAAQVDITPPVGFRTGGGYGEVISTGIDDPLLAKALVLQQGNCSAAIVISDLLSVPPDLSRRAREGASARTGIPVDHIVIAATHNHGSPEYWGSLRDIAHEAAVKRHGTDPHERVDYHRKLVDAWIAAIVAAADAQQPATVEMVVAQQLGLAFNRRFHMKDGTVRFNPGAGNPNIIRPAGPVDTELPFLIFRQKNQSRTPIASMTTFAMHTAVHGGTTFSGDFPAVLQSRLQKSLGRDLVSLFAEGTAGDINHVDVSRTDQLRGRPEVVRIGEALSATIKDQLGNTRPLQAPELAVVSKTVFAPFHPVSAARYREAMHQLREQQSQRLGFLTLVAAWRDCHRYRYSQVYDDKKPLEVQAIRLDVDTALVFLPHEVFVDIGLAIKKHSPFQNTIVVSLANDIDYYIPTQRAFEEGSYEVTTCPLDPGCGEILLAAANDALLMLNER